jgi:hypothetical protein
MKYLTLVLCLFTVSGYSQALPIKEVRYKPDPRFFDTPDSTIVYPVIVLKDTAAGRSINDVVKADILPSDGDRQGNPPEALRNYINDGLTTMMYEVSFSRNGLLSLSVYREEGVSPILSFYSYFNFDTRTGKSLALEDLIDSSKIDSLKAIVLKKKVALLNQYKARDLKKYLKQGLIDAATYQEILEKVDGACTAKLRIENFSLSGLQLSIMDPCEISGQGKAYQPTIELRYPYKLLYPFLKPVFRERLE